MTGLRWCASLFAMVCVPALADAPRAAVPAAGSATVRAIRAADGHVAAIEAGPLSAEVLAKLNQSPNAQRELPRLLSVAVDDAKPGAGAPDVVASAGVAIAGSHSLDGRTLRFTPRFAFRAGQAYRAEFRPSELEPPNPAAPAASSAGAVTYRFREPEGASAPPTEVIAIYPSAAILPENQLRFYIHFSAPMSRGDAYDHVRLLDGRDRPVDLPFLELGEELWDPRQQRLTLLIDPGRIKRGVKPREDIGPALRAGETFTLVVDDAWRDARSRGLGKSMAKRFRVGAPIQEAIDPAQWKIAPPRAGSREALAIEFPRPLDRALLERTLTIRSASGAPIEGEALISREERQWELRPEHDWAPGKYELLVDSALEDLAGNRVGRAFEVAADGGAAGGVPGESARRAPIAARLEFDIRSAP